jgi:hypothetical protein
LSGIEAWLLLYVFGNYVGDWQSHEKKPRETILGAEFANAIRVINQSLSEENRLKFLHWDLNKHSRKYFTCPPHTVLSHINL